MIRDITNFGIKYYTNQNEISLSKNKKASYPFGPMYTAISNILHMSVNACFFAQLASTLSTK